MDCQPNLILCPSITTLTPHLRTQGPGKWTVVSMGFTCTISPSGTPCPLLVEMRHRACEELCVLAIGCLARCKGSYLLRSAIHVLSSPTWNRNRRFRNILFYLHLSLFDVGWLRGYLSHLAVFQENWISWRNLLLYILQSSF